MLQIIKILLVLAVAAWGLLGALHNIADWGGTVGAVGAVTSMSTIGDEATKWQAVNVTALNWLGAIFIMGSKVAAAVLCMIGAVKMTRARSGGLAMFGAAKTCALAGCAVAVFMLFGGFIVMAEGWFELWRSDAMRAPVLDSAFRYAGLIALIAIFVGMEEQ